MSSSSTDNILVKLKTISKIPIGGRVRTSYPETISIIEPCNGFTLQNVQEFRDWVYDRYQSFLRTYNRDSRIQMIFVLDNLFKSAIDITNSIMDSKYLNTDYDHPSDDILNKQEEQYDLLKTFKTELNETLKGIQNLKNTYLEDAETCAKLDVMIRNIELQIIKIGKKTNCNHNTIQNDNVSLQNENEDKDDFLNSFNV